MRELRDLSNSEIRHHVVSFTYVVPELLKPGKRAFSMPGDSSASWIDDGTRYGNASVGFNGHTAGVAEGHQQFNQPMGMNVVQASAGFAALSSLIQRWAYLE